MGPDASQRADPVPSPSPADRDLARRVPSRIVTQPGQWAAARQARAVTRDCASCGPDETRLGRAPLSRPPSGGGPMPCMGIHLRSFTFYSPHRPSFCLPFWPRPRVRCRPPEITNPTAYNASRPLQAPQVSESADFLSYLGRYPTSVRKSLP